MYMLALSRPTSANYSHVVPKSSALSQIMLVEKHEEEKEKKRIPFLTRERGSQTDYSKDDTEPPESSFYDTLVRWQGHASPNCPDLWDMKTL